MRGPGFKYGNKPRRVDGVLFQSTKEARRYQELKALQMAGVIRDLELQPKFDLDVNGVRVCRYFGDFRYYDNERNQTVVEDVKTPGTRTKEYAIKARLMLAVHGIEVEET